MPGRLSRILTASIVLLAGAPFAAADITFDDESSSSNFETLIGGQYLHGSAWGDVNNDGYPDLLAGIFNDSDGSHGPNRLLINNQNGTFSESVQASINVNDMEVSGAAFADFDNDGDADLVVGDHNLSHTRIYQNSGSGSFTDVTAGSNLDFANFPGRTPFTFDYDGDGNLDILLQHDVYNGSTFQSRLMRNEGNFTFSDQTASAGLPTAGGGSDGLIGLGGAVGDFNGDGAPDFYIPGPTRDNWQVTNNRMFLNDGDGTFTEYTSNSVFNDAGDWNTQSNDDWPVGAAAGDLNNDGKLDLVAGHHFKSAVTDVERQPVRVFINQGNDGSGQPLFADVTDAAGIEGLYTREPHVEIQDIDNDGYMDIIVSAIMTDTGQGGAQRPVVFRNTLGETGTLGFELNAGMDPTTSSGHWLDDLDRNPYYFPGAPTADYDRDGRLDVMGQEAISTDIPKEGGPRPSPLFRNTSGDGNHWLDILVDASSQAAVNNQGIGSQVFLFEAGHVGELAHLLGMQEIQVTNGFSSGTEPIAHFGLADLERVDVLVSLPWNAGTWTVLGLGANQRYTVSGNAVIPEPGTLALAGLGALMLLAPRRRRAARA